MSEFDITTDEETPVQRAAFGETLRTARARDQFDRARDTMMPWERAELDAAPKLHPALEANLRRNPFAGNPYDAARSMVAIVLRKRQTREARTQRRELAAYLTLGAMLVALTGAVPFAPTVVASIALTAAVFVAGMLAGLTLRSKL